MNPTCTSCGKELNMPGYPDPSDTDEDKFLRAWNGEQEPELCSRCFKDAHKCEVIYFNEVRRLRSL